MSFQPAPAPGLPNERGIAARARAMYHTQEFHEGLWFYGFISFGLVSFLVFQVYPSFKTVFMSFERWGYFKSEWVGLHNYADILKDGIYWKAVRNTLRYSVWTVAMQIIETLILAIAVSRLSGRAQSFFRGAFYLPGLAGGIVVSVIWMWIFTPMGGLLNYLVGLVGIEPQLWLWDERLALGSLIFMSVVTISGGTLLLFLAAIAGVPKTLYESADLDGASVFRQAVRITVPLIKPVVLYVTIMGTIGAMQMFESAWVLTRGGGPNFSTMTMVYYIMKSAWIDMMFGSAAAQIVLLGLFLLIIAAIQFRYLASNVEY